MIEGQFYSQSPQIYVTILARGRGVTSGNSIGNQTRVQRRRQLVTRPTDSTARYVTTPARRRASDC